MDTLCGKAKEDGLEMPGPVRKFLAKDIMFAGGGVPGWEVHSWNGGIEHSVNR